MARDLTTRHTLPGASPDPITKPAGPAPRDGALPAPVVADVIRVVNDPGHPAWMRQIRRIGGCAHPLHLTGYTVRRDPTTGHVVQEHSSNDYPGSVVLVACGNRREIACPACSRVYHADVFHLVRAGLLGGKSVPETVTGHPRIFLTLTAPGFGPVHTIRTSGNGPQSGRCTPRRATTCPHGVPAACWARHRDDDPLLGTPLCPDCYDYDGAVIWQASLGTLWRRFVIYLPRHLARAAGLTHPALRSSVRLSYVKIVEFQRRGLVHVHAVLRADAAPGADSPVQRPPEWVTPALLATAARQAASAVHVSVHAAGIGTWDLAWGPQLDVQDITTPDRDERTGQKIASYIAKYATKSTEVTGWTTRTGAEDTPRGAHARRMMATALALAEHPDLEDLKLGRWARHLAFRGHVSS
ncbi:MAG: hypothetical protein QG597_1697, partial [Actinomycetota bacterium]|nr:hypothetical protein [Actinomycetota bacterium]